MLPRPLAGFKGSYFSGKEREGRRKGGEGNGRRRKGRKGMEGEGEMRGGERPLFKFPTTPLIRGAVLAAIVTVATGKPSVNNSSLYATKLYNKDNIFERIT